MLEIRVEFRSHEEWSAWVAQHGASFEPWRQSVLGDVARFGLVEPISEVKHPPRAISINRENLRESVSAAEMNSRKRAGLLALDLACRLLPPERRHRTKVLGAEGITRVARVLRGAYPHFLGTEYLPTAEEKERHYPVPHLDLMNADFPDGVFDLFYSGDVFEHVPDLDRVLSEVARLLRPGGIMVSTFPFSQASPTTQRRASLDADGRVIHHQLPEYHGNPMRPAEGSLVFLVPGWDVLQKARAAGFADAVMTLILSSSLGIVSAPVPGIFVMSALKAKAEGGNEPGGGRLPSLAFRYQGPRLDRIIGLAGLARSGTTLLCSILGVHSQIESVYEPFNASKERTLPPRLGISQFFAEFPTDMRGKEILLVKETGTQIAFLDRTAELLRSVAPPLRKDLIVLLRNPLHAFLSMLEARKKWWGGPHEISVEIFEEWAAHNLAALSRLLQMGREFGGLLLSYEALVARKERLVPTLMHHLGLEFEERQLDFEKYVEKQRVRGDVTIATEPLAISDARVRARAAELAAVTERLAGAAAYGRVRKVQELITAFAEVGAARFDTPAAQNLIRPLREILAG